MIKGWHEGVAYGSRLYTCGRISLEGGRGHEYSRSRSLVSFKNNAYGIICPVVDGKRDYKELKMKIVAQIFKELDIKPREGYLLLSRIDGQE